MDVAVSASEKRARPASRRGAGRVPFAVRALLVMALATLAPTPVHGRDTDTLEHRVTALVQPLVEEQRVVGMVVGVLDGRQSHILGYGRVSSSRDAPPDGRTIFEIGSVTKLFTALLLAELVEHDAVRLDEPVANLLPASVRVPKAGEQPITLLQLSTHTSGLPRLPTNFSPFDRQNPYADYTIEQLYDFLAQYELPRRPGLLYHYSNVGVGLLGHALAFHFATTYEKLLRTWILEPLGLQSTAIELDERLRARHAQGHDRERRPVPDWEIPTLAAAGGLHSSAQDLLVFLSANLGLTETPQWAAMQTTHVPRLTIRQEGDAIGLGWHIRPDGVLWHNGQTGGYSSYVAIDELHRAGVVVLSNSAVSPLDEEVGRKVLEMVRTR